jgi:hypothetical protein
MLQHSGVANLRNLLRPHHPAAADPLPKAMTVNQKTNSFEFEIFAQIDLNT